MSNITDERRQWIRERASKDVAKTLASTAACWGGGWHAITEDHRRGELAWRLMASVEEIGMSTEEMGVYCIALTRECLRVKLR